MYAPPLRIHYESILSSILGEDTKLKSSLLLQAYVTFSAMISNDRAKFIYLQVRTTDEYRSTIHEHVGKTGESMNAFILRAISETMARDQSKIK